MNMNEEQWTPTMRRMFKRMEKALDFYSGIVTPMEAFVVVSNLLTGITGRQITITVGEAEDEGL